MHYFRNWATPLLIVLAMFSTAQAQTELNEQGEDFSSLYDLVYQIVVIDTETNNKSALGSGFQISEDGLVVTNYHVISGFVFEPDHHRVEYVDQSGDTGVLQLVTFDVINDLAILKRENASSEFFPLAADEPSRGDSIYALGNPHDIGMLLVSGAYNGLADSSYNDQILYSGSLNPGMSGGPTVNEDGEVVGVNVATAGSQLSFLVPVSKVYDLLTKVDAPLVSESFLDHISTQIRTFQTHYFSQLLNADWALEDLGDYAQVPGEMGLDTNCWGRSNEDNEDALMLQLQLVCNNSNRVYLQPGFNTGVLHYSYFFYEAKDIGAYRFHKLASDTTYNPDNWASDDEVTPYECEQRYIDPVADEPGENVVQIGFCSRSYINLEGLYDTLFYRTSANNSQALTTHFTLAGVDRSVALQFAQRFMEESKWK